jgi:hypothetical protein
MTKITDLIGLGTEPSKAVKIGVDTVTSAAARASVVALTAAGTTITDALQLSKFNNIISTTAASTGVKLPSQWPIGQIGFVQNNGANALNLFPPSATTSINGGTVGAAVTIAAAAGNLIIRNSATDFGAYVMAKEA